MNTNLEDDSERVVDEHYRRSARRRTILKIHQASYELVADRCRDKDVLDLGCGSGYGTARVANVAAQVTGADPNEAAIDYARSHHARQNLKFERIEPDRELPFGDRRFDVVLSFQVIEHVEDVSAYLAEIMRVLRPGGEAVIITPDRRNRLFSWQRPWNRWHRREYSWHSLLRDVSAHAAKTHCQVMLAREPWSSTELSRYRWYKWLSIPFTLPFWPERQRVACIDRVHSALVAFGVRGRPGTAGPEASDSSLSIEDRSPTPGVRLVDDDCRSINLFCVASKDG